MKWLKSITFVEVMLWVSIATLLLAGALLSGCTAAERSRLAALGNTFKVTMYSGGTVVRTWTSTGKVLTEENSDGWYFVDSATSQLVRVSGDVVVEQID